MSEVTIVALPDQSDQIRKISSEKEPHLTLLFLGKVGPDDLQIIIEYVQYACESSLRPFGLSGDFRGLLGPDNADVLFFEKDRNNIEVPVAARDFFLKNEAIKKAYDATEQYPEWIPHLTLGYPATPARPDTDNILRYSYVHFDRIAVWFEDSAGIEFRLKYPRSDYGEEVLMSDNMKDFLEHFGVKGMRWGVRKDAVEVSTSSAPGRKVSAIGGQNQPAHDDAVRAAASKQKAKASTTDALSTKELQDLVTRMNLEQQYSNLTNRGKSSSLEKGQKQVKTILGIAKTYNEVQNFLNTPGGKIVKDTINTAVKAKLRR